MNVLVVPTIRAESIKEFLGLWKELKEYWDEIIVIEDNPQKTFDINLKHHYSWAEIEKDLGENFHIISRRDSSIRSYGFLVAYRLGAEYICSLDDDCHPVGNIPYFCNQHIDRLTKSSKWTESILGMKTRGIPYKKLGTLDNVVFNMGLWKGVPDLDSIQTLSGGMSVTDFEPPQTDRIMPIGQYFPLCGMNIAFKREVAVLSYFAPMGEKQPFHRFDDIWFGVVLKKICDHLGLLISCGNPIIHHKRASDPFVNLVKEAPGIKANEEFWTIIDAIPLIAKNPKECLLEIAENLEKQIDTYLQGYGKSLYLWASYFD